MSRAEDPPRPTASAESFVGRDAELASLRERLIAERAPLTTITGPGGAGKTRLAREIAARLAGEMPGGIPFIDLSGARDAADVIRTAAATLGAALPAENSSDAGRDPVREALRDRERCIVILDNFEQVAACAPETVGEWLAANDRVQFLVTSRWPLGLAAERVLPLEPLPLDGGDGDPPAVRLFIDRAAAAHPGIVIGAAERTTIREICAELDGLPLAIEIAASRARLLGPREILERLRDRFRRLDRRAAGEDGARRTLHGTIDWSFRLLDPVEQEVFLATCIFRGGFTAEAAESVIGEEGGGAALLDAIESIAEKQLLRVREGPSGTRLDRLVSVDAFGREELERRFDPERRQALARRHAKWCLDAAERWRGPPGTAPGPDARARLVDETDNFLAAIDGLLASGEVAAAARIALAAEGAWRGRGSPEPLRELLARVRAGLGDGEPAIAARTAIALSAASRRAGRSEAALSAANDALALARQAGEPGIEAEALLERAEVRRAGRDLPGAEEDLARSRALLDPGGASAALALCELRAALVLAASGRAAESLDLVRSAEAMARSAGDLQTLAACLVERGRQHSIARDFPAVLPCLLEAESLYRSLGDPHGVASVLAGRGHELQRRGELDGALAAFGEAERGFRDTGDRAGLCAALSQRGLVATRLGRFGEALRAHAESAALARELGDRNALAREIGNRGVVEFRSGDLDAALASFLEAESLARELGDRHRIGKEMLNRGLVLLERERLDEALDCFSETERIFRELAYPRFLASSIGNRAVVLARRGRTDEAHAALRETLEILERSGDGATHEYFAYQAELARAESALGRPLESKVSAELALDLARRLEFDESHPDAEIRASLEELHRLAERPFRIAMRPSEGPETIDAPPPQLSPTISALPGPAAPGAPATGPRSAYGLDALIGGTLGGCRILSLIDRGGMGAVYLAERLADGARVALKTILPGLHPHPSRLQRFLLEARVSGRFRSPHVVAVHEIGQDGELHYIVMEYVPGGNLAQRAQRARFGVIGPIDAIRWLAEGARALAEAEELGILHRDLKPQNLLFDAADRLKVADFGLAKDLEASFDITSSRSQPGTPLYMSPEQAAFEPLDHRSDQWSLGASFYSALTGLLPAEGASPMEVLRRKLEIPRLSPAQRLPSGLIPAGLNAIIERMTARDPRERFPGFVELLATIEALPPAAREAPR